MDRQDFALSACAPSDADDDTLVARLVTMINAAYLRGEGLEATGGMWKGGKVTRTTNTETRELLRQRKLIFCRQAADLTSAASLVGCVLCDVNFDPELRVAELGMLCVDATCLKRGVGRLLMQEAEATARRAGCVAIRLELLTPRDFEHPVKAWLDAWYQREGYVKGATEDFALAYPRIARILIPCVFTCYRKELQQRPS